MKKILLFPIILVVVFGFFWTNEIIAITWNSPTAITDDNVHDMGLSVSCPTSDYCMATWQKRIGASGAPFRIYYSEWTSGGGWTTDTTISSSTLRSSHTSVSCPDNDYCIATWEFEVGGAGAGDHQIYYSEWTSGGDWTALNPISSANIWKANQYSSISCPDNDFCIVTWSNGDGFSFPKIRYSRWNGSTWTPPGVITSSGGLSSVSCPTDTYCMATWETSGHKIYYSEWKSGSWSAAIAITNAGINEYASVSCHDNDHCMATWSHETGGGGSGIWQIYYSEWTSGGGWTTGAITNDANYNRFPSVSCPANDYCIATWGNESDWEIYYSEWNGSTWINPVVIPSIDQGRRPSVSCPTSDYCMATWIYGSGLIDNYEVYYSNTISPIITFVRAIQGDSDDTSIFQNSDGTYIGADQSGLFKLDSLGNLLWVKGVSAGELKNIRENAGGGFFALYENHVVKFDSGGNVDWAKNIGITGPKTFEGYSIQEATTVPGYIIAGKSEEGFGINDFYLLKLDINGDLLWAKAISSDLSRSATRDTGSDVQETKDGGYIAVGSIDYDNNDAVNPGGDILLIKFDQNGTLTWARKINTLASPRPDFGYGIRQTLDDGYIIVGQTTKGAPGVSKKLFLIKTDSSGIIDWATIITDHLWEGRPHVVQQTINDGGYIVASNSSVFGNDDILLFKFDSSGNLTWVKKIEGPEEESVDSIQQTSDNGFIISGGTTSFGLGGTFVLKLDSNGELQEPCPFLNITDVTTTFLGSVLTNVQNDIGFNNTDITATIEIDNNPGVIVPNLALASFGRSPFMQDVCLGPDNSNNVCEIGEDIVTNPGECCNDGCDGMCTWVDKYDWWCKDYDPDCACENSNSCCATRERLGPGPFDGYISCNNINDNDCVCANDTDCPDECAGGTTLRDYSCNTVTGQCEFTDTDCFDDGSDCTAPLCSAGSCSLPPDNEGFDCGPTCEVCSGGSCDSACDPITQTCVADICVINTYTLTVNKAGAGTGTVVGGGISCDPTCASDTETFNFGDMVLLTATESVGSSFAGWINCDDPDGNNCTMTMDADKTVTATFDLMIDECGPAVCPSDGKSCTDDICQNPADPNSVCIYPNKADGDNCGNCKRCDNAGSCDYTCQPDEICDSDICVPGDFSGDWNTYQAIIGEGATTVNTLIAYQGLVPCGKISCIDPTINTDGEVAVDTDDNPTCNQGRKNIPCQFCHTLVMVDAIVDFFILNIVFPVAVLILVIGGVVFITSFGSPGKFAQGKAIITAAVIGIAIMLSAWLIVNTVLSFIGVASWTGLEDNWFKINCPVEIAAVDRCDSDSDCDDSNSCTNDVCQDPASDNSICVYDDEVVGVSCGTCMECDGSGGCNPVASGTGCGECRACDGAGSCDVSADGTVCGTNCEVCLGGSCTGCDPVTEHCFMNVCTPLPPWYIVRGNGDPEEVIPVAGDRPVVDMYDYTGVRRHGPGIGGCYRGGDVSVPAVEGVSMFFLYEFGGVVSLVGVSDKVFGSGGHAHFRLSGVNGTTLRVADDPGVWVYPGGAKINTGTAETSVLITNNTANANWAWNGVCSDGGVIGNIPSGCITIEKRSSSPVNRPWKFVSDDAVPGIPGLVHLDLADGEQLQICKTF